MTPIPILLVEDNDGDIILILEALKEGKVNNKISIAGDGEQAIQFLNKAGTNTQARRPGLILMDTKLPHIERKEVLIYAKTNPQLKVIPVKMLLTSTTEKDVLESCKNYPNCYIPKPVDFDKSFEVVQKIENFWISIVQLPKND